MPWFGQEHFVAAQAKGGLDSTEYTEALAEIRKLAREEGIDKVLKEHNLDALVAPTAGPPWLTDYIKGDNSGGGFTSPAAVAGYPHVTVPAGFVGGLRAASPSSAPRGASRASSRSRTPSSRPRSRGGRRSS
jgi:amidase